MEMDWTLSGVVPCRALLPLGHSFRGRYHRDLQCLGHLNDLLAKLEDEDPVSRPLRRSLFIMDVLQKDLVPILIDSKDQPAIFQSTVRLLAGMTVPVECLVSAHVADLDPASHHIVHDLTHQLYSAKEAFLDPRATRAIIDQLNSMLEKQPLSMEDSKTVNYSLLLLRNVLHAPERPGRHLLVQENSLGVSAGKHVHADQQGMLLHTTYSASHNYSTDSSQQNRLMWNLFAQGLDRLLMALLSCSQKHDWVATIVQLIALFYKDQHVESMQKLLATWLDMTSSDSSEDDESNTSPPIGSRSSPPMLTSPDPTSDSSDSVHRNANQTGGVMGDVTETEERPGRKTMVHKMSMDTSSIVSGESRRSSQHSSSSGFHSEPPAQPTGPSQDKECRDRYKEIKRRSHVIPSNPSNSNSNKTGGGGGGGGGSYEDDATPANMTSSREDSKCKTKRDVKLAHGNKAARASASGDKKEEQLEQQQQQQQQPQQHLQQQQQLRHKRWSKKCMSIRKINVRTAAHYMPTDNDISQLLKAFTVDFLLNGYNTLVGELHRQLVHEGLVTLDKSHFLWLITYFLRFASQLQLDCEHFSSILSVDLLSYLTWEAVQQTEQMEMAVLQPAVSDLKPVLRRLHLGVTAMRELLQALDTYSRLTNLSTEHRQMIAAVRGSLPAIADLPQLFLLQLRCFNPAVHSRRYLRDLITTNHVLLLSLERAVQQPAYEGSFDMRQHLSQFCSTTVLAHFGAALEDFKTNGPFVNDCIMTVLHHIGADLGRADLLCDPIILRPFSKIWGEDYNMCDDWNDLIEYVVHKFLRNFDSPDPPPPATPGGFMSAAAAAASVPPPLFESTEHNYQELMASDIYCLKAKLIDTGFQEQILWMQKCLLIACSVRLGTYLGKEFKQPIACLSYKSNMACPMVPWTCAQASALRSRLYLYLLHRMGLLPDNSVGIYPRIPAEWDADTLYSVALFLGKVEAGDVDFDLHQVRQVDLPIPSTSQDLPSGVNPQWMPHYFGSGPSTSFSMMPRQWLHWVEHSGSLHRSAERASIHSSIQSMSSNRPLDSVSTTSSLEVHKTESIDDEEMGDCPSVANMEADDVWFAPEPSAQPQQPQDPTNQVEEGDHHS